MLQVRDTIQRIITHQFAAVCSEPFEYGGAVFSPRRLRVSPDLFRGFTCPPNCGACCFRVTLDWLPSEPRPYTTTVRTVEINGVPRVIYSDIQDNHDAVKCHNLRQADGRCSIHGKHPMSCDFEFVKFTLFAEPSRATQLNQRLFGRGWTLTRVTGEKGNACEITPEDEQSYAEVLRKLSRLQSWMEYFHVPSKIPAIIQWARSDDRSQALFI